MAEDKSLKSTKPSKKKKLCPEVEELPAENTTEAVVKKKRRKAEAEEAPELIPLETVTADTKQKKRKRKKKQEAKVEEAEEEVKEEEKEGKEEEELSPEEKRVLERKMKKILKKEEKKRLRADGETAKREEESGPTAPQQALNYLTCWAEKRTEWKFQKKRQTWLLQHMFHSDKIPDENFSVLLEYLEGLRGGSRDTTVQKALALVEESGTAPEDETVQQRAHRAREVIQLLS